MLSQEGFNEDIIGDYVLKNSVLVESLPKLILKVEKLLRVGPIIFN